MNLASDTTHVRMATGLWARHNVGAVTVTVRRGPRRGGAMPSGYKYPHFAEQNETARIAAGRM